MRTKGPRVGLAVFHALHFVCKFIYSRKKDEIGMWQEVQVSWPDSWPAPSSAIHVTVFSGISEWAMPDNNNTPP